VKDKTWICRECQHLMKESIKGKKVILHDAETGEVKEIPLESVEVVSCQERHEISKVKDSCPDFKPKAKRKE